MYARAGVITISLAILIGLLGGSMAYQAMSNRPVVESSTDTTPVVTAARDIAPGTKLSGKDLQVVQFPATHLPEAYFTGCAELVGRTSSAPLFTAEPVLACKLEGDGGSVSQLIPVDMRAVCLQIDGMAGLAADIESGDRVDVISTREKSNRKGFESRTVLQNVRVFSILQDDGRRRRGQPTTVTLLVDLEQAELLATTLLQGTLQLALRNPGDHQLVERQKPTPPRRWRKPRAPAPPPAPEPMPVTIIRGSEVSREMPINSTRDASPPASAKPDVAATITALPLPKKTD